MALFAAFLAQFSKAYKEVIHEDSLKIDLSNPDDKAIDKLVYELYELTPEEIKIVEGALT